MRADEQQLKAWMVGGLGGDGRAHAALLHALVPILRTFYGRRLRNDGETEDLIQETLIAVHTRRMSFDRDRPFTAWMYAIARHKLIDHLRRTSPTTAIEECEDLVACESFEEASNAAIDVGQLLDGLPAKQADAIRRTRLQGYSIAEAAKAGGIGESDVKVSVHRGLKALMERLRGDGHGH